MEQLRRFLGEQTKKNRIMSDFTATNSKPLLLGRYTLTLLAVWTMLIGAVLAWNLVHHNSKTLEVARHHARSAFEKDLVYRRWVTEHGGLYVPATQKTPPNPLLAGVPERDITTPSGRLLTLINPAYMTRQVHELGAEQYGLRGHITSLTPLRPENGPDAWEAEALRALARGASEVTTVEQISGDPCLRLMRPVITEQRCLKCHAKQGHQVGDIRGGVSVSVPLAPLRAIARTEMINVAWGHGFLWLLGSAGIFLITGRLGQRVRERDRARNSLWESRQMLRLVLDSIPVGVYWKDRDLNYLGCNRHAALDAGLETPTDIVGKSDHQLAWRNRADDQRRDDLRVIESGEARLECEERVARPEGQVGFLRVNKIPLRDRLGNIVGLLGTYEDITERKRAEQRRALVSQVLELLNRSGAGLDVIEDLLSAIKAFTGFEAVAIRLKSGADYPYYSVLGFPSDFVEAERYLCPRDATGEVQRDADGNPVLECMCGNVIRGRTDDSKPFFTEGRSFWTNSTTDLLACTTGQESLAPIRNRCNGVGYESVVLVPLRSGTEVIGLLQLNDRRQGMASAEMVTFLEGIGTSIGIAFKRRQVEDALRQSEERIRAVFEQAAVGVAQVETDTGRFVRVNKKYCDVVGLSEEEVRSTTFTAMTHPDDVGAELENMARLQDGEIREFSIEKRYSRRDGSSVWVNLTVSPMWAPGEMPSHHIAVTEDITERKRSEEALKMHAAALERANQALADASGASRAANRALQASVSDLAHANHELTLKNAELDEFSYVASHDLQEPLRKLTSFSELLIRDLGEDLPEVAARDLEFIIDASSRMQALVQELLRLSRAGRSVMECEPVSLSTCVDQALEALSARITETGAEITRDDLPEVYGDATMLTQLYQNLICNALKFVDSGTRPVVRCSADNERGELVLAVRDNGIGIAPEYAAQVFTPFKRLHGRGEYEGTGIGLAICRKTVERHRGRLWVESDGSGQGSAFCFVIPDPRDGTYLGDSDRTEQYAEASVW